MVDILQITYKVRFLKQKVMYIDSNYDEIRFSVFNQQ